MTVTRSNSERNAFDPRVPVSEVEAIQSPALGAYLLWRAGASYQAASPRAPRLDLHFLILPLLLYAPTLSAITSTNPTSGLAKFVHKMLSTESELIALNSRALELRELTLRSLSLGVSGGLMAVNHDSAEVYSLDVDKKPAVPDAVRLLERGAERLGQWFASLPDAQVFSMLRVAY